MLVRRVVHKFEVLLALDLDLLVIGRVGQVDDIGRRWIGSRRGWRLKATGGGSSNSYRVSLLLVVVVIIERGDGVVKFVVAKRLGRVEMNKLHGAFGQVVVY